jgi:hypothetical protein
MRVAEKLDWKGLTSSKVAVHKHRTRILIATELIPLSSLTAEVETDLEELLSHVTTGLIYVRLIGLRLVPLLRFLYLIHVIVPYKLRGVNSTESAS